MKLYRSNDGRWFGTQDDARKAVGKAWEPAEVPVDKPGLLDWLNNQQPIQPSQAQVEVADKFFARPSTADRLARLGEEPVEAAKPKLNLAPLHFGANWREVRGGIEEGAKGLSLDAALTWIECATARVRALVAGAEPVETETTTEEQD